MVAPGRSGLPDKKRRPRFPRFAPDFVVEVQAPEDRLSRLRPKMHEWVENGAGLAWLVDPKGRAVEIYRPGREPETLVGAVWALGEPQV